MKKILLTFAIVFSAVLVYAQPPEGNAIAGDGYGQRIDAKGAISLANLSKKLKRTKPTPEKLPVL